MSARVSVCLLLLPLMACEGLSSLDAPRDTTGVADCDGLPAVSLTELFTRHFGPGSPTSCVGCHGPGSGGLKFQDAATFFLATVDRPTTQAGKKRVVAFDPGQSALYQRLLPEAGNKRMPANGKYLDEAALRDVAGWICEGALNDAPPASLTLTSFAPDSAVPGDTVSVTGSGFSDLVTARVGNIAAEIAFVSDTRVDLIIPDGATTAKIWLTQGPLTVSSEAPLTLVPSGPVTPVLSSIEPCGVVQGSAPFTMTLTGSQFVSGATVTLNGQTVSTTWVSQTELRATIPAAAVAAAPVARVASITVNNPNGGGASNSLDFGIAGLPATFSAVQGIFTAKCAGCHNGGATSPDLRAGNSYASLVGVTPSGATCSTAKRVWRCSPQREKSVLIDKILATTTSLPCAGQPMPRGQPALPNDEKAILMDWVALGAPR